MAYLLLGLSVNVDALQDIGGTSSAAYMQLCDVLAKDVLEESEGRLGKWEAFYGVCGTYAELLNLKYVDLFRL